MAEGQKSGYDGSPLAPVNGYARSDAEAATANTEELRRQKRKKCLLYVVAFVIFQTGIILLFSMTVMKVKTPKFRVRSASFPTFETTNSSFTLKMNAQLGVKNTNFGPYKYGGDSTVSFYYKDTQLVGSVAVPKSKAGMRSTKKINVAVDLSSASLSSSQDLASDISSGTLSLTSKSRLNGKVELMFIFKKKKSVDMYCTMDINLSTKQLQNIECK